MTFVNINKTEGSTTFTSESGVSVTMPNSAYIVVDDESGLKAIKATGSRATIGLIEPSLI